MRSLKEPTTMRLSERTKALLAALAARHDCTQTAVVERSVREMAEREGLAAESEAGNANDR